MKALQANKEEVTDNEEEAKVVTMPHIKTRKLGAIEQIVL